MAEHEHADAVIAGLQWIGEPEPLRSDDLVRAEGTLRAFQDARRRRARSRVAWVGSATAMAAALVLGWVALPRVQGVSIEVTQGAFELQQDRLDSGARVPAGEWIEITDGRACLRIAARQACGEQGTRLRVTDQGELELGHGRVRVEDGLGVTTAFAVIESDGGTLEIELGSAPGTITVLEGSASVRGSDAVLGVGTHALVDDEPAARAGSPGVVAQRDTIAATDVVDDEPVITAGDAPDVTEPPSARRSSAREPASVRAPVTVAGAGEMLASARALASANRLEPAARAYQKLIDTHPSSSEARAALVSLGRVQASRGRNAAALAAFSAYLQRGGGALSEEAHWGRISALHALGRAAERDAAITSLGAAHPRSVYLRKALELAADG